MQKAGDTPKSANLQSERRLILYVAPFKVGLIPRTINQKRININEVFWAAGTF